MSSMHDLLSHERKALQATGELPEWYTTQAWQMFKKTILVPTEGNVIERFKTIARTLAQHLPVLYRAEYEALFFDHMWDNILSPSSTVLANTGTKRGHIVSCSGQKLDDSVRSFYKNLTETAILSKYSYGTSIDADSIRPRGAPFGEHGLGEANGVWAVAEDFFTCASKISQGNLRKGNVAVYLDIMHPDFDECINALRRKTSTTNFGWKITDATIELLKAGDTEANRRWRLALWTKLLTGKGYLFFPDKANRHRPQMYKDLGLDIVATNLCTEIMLHSSFELTYSCVLASLNLVHWDKIKTGNHIFVATVFLDCVVSEFLETIKDDADFTKIYEMTRKGRAIGLGYMGFSTYLQEKRIPFESLEAYFLNKQMYKRLHDESLRASQWLASILGEPEWCKGHGVRNTHRTAQAPTKSSSVLMGGVSEAVFPDPGMCFTAGSSAGELNRITPVFYKLMVERGQYNPENITSIVNKLGSVQHLDWLTHEEKRVFRTAYEMDQRVILRMAEARQQYLCQGQSLNFYLHEETAEDDISNLLSACALSEWILSVYYCYTRSGVIIGECISCSQ